MGTKNNKVRERLAELFGRVIENPETERDFELAVKALQDISDYMNVLSANPSKYFDLDPVLHARSLKQTL